MKGTDVSPAEIENAKTFLKMVSKIDWPEDDQQVRITRAELVRLVAWYGAIRGKNAPPGELVHTKSGENNDAGVRSDT